MNFPVKDGKNVNTTGSTNSTTEQDGKVFVGPGAKKEAGIVGLGLNKLRSFQIVDLERAKKYAIDQSVRFVMERQRQAHQQQQQKVALYSQALALMSRIYIGSVNFDVSEDQIRSVFGIYGPIKNVNMSIDPTTGVGRQDSTPQAQPIIDMVMTEARQYNRVFVASVHPDITEIDLRSVFMAFGEITKCQLAKQPIGKRHRICRGFGYIDFKTSASVKEAVEGMNGFDLGGQILKVGRCVTPPDALHYLSSGGSTSALPAAAAIAAAEATAKIHAQEASGRSSSPRISNSPPYGISPTSRALPSPASSPQTELTGQQSATSSGTGSQPAGRRRGFGGFAGSVQPPAIVLPLPAIPSTQPKSASTNASGVTTSAVTAPGLVIPQLGNTVAASQIKKELDVSEIKKEINEPQPKNNLEASQFKKEAPLPQKDVNVDSFYSALNDETFEPPKLAIPPQLQQTAIETSQTEQKKVKTSKLDFLDRIGEKVKSKYDSFDPSKPASFLPSVPNTSKDSDDEEAPAGGPLAIGGPEAWTALAIREDTTIAKTKTEVAPKTKQKKGKNDRQVAHRRKGKCRKTKYSSGPKLNTATKIAAANVAGALSDQLQTQREEKGEEASLASQEHVQIRGNDARHLLIQKLMRTNRSSVILLKNMVEPKDVDEFLEDEIKEECRKYGTVTDVVIVQEEDTQTVKIFVRFCEPTQAEEARKAIDGRYFDGRTVTAQSYDQVLFDHDDFTG
uniref:RRM domain-containing protein n=1 Tax=Meloidogyne hapla TaxID=6305 RepID=A0A1I8B323_MELHA